MVRKKKNQANHIQANCIQVRRIQPCAIFNLPKQLHWHVCTFLSFRDVCFLLTCSHKFSKDWIEFITPRFHWYDDVLPHCKNTDMVKSYVWRDYQWGKPRFPIPWPNNHITSLTIDSRGEGQWKYPSLPSSLTSLCFKRNYALKFDFQEYSLPNLVEFKYSYFCPEKLSLSHFPDTITKLDASGIIFMETVKWPPNLCWLTVPKDSVNYHAFPQTLTRLKIPSFGGAQEQTQSLPTRLEKLHLPLKVFEQESFLYKQWRIPDSVKRLVVHFSWLDVNSPLNFGHLKCLKQLSFRGSAGFRHRVHSLPPTLESLSFRVVYLNLDLDCIPSSLTELTVEDTDTLHLKSDQDNRGRINHFLMRVDPVCLVKNWLKT